MTDVAYGHARGAVLLAIQKFRKSFLIRDSSEAVFVPSALAYKTPPRMEDVLSIVAKKVHFLCPIA